MSSATALARSTRTRPLVRFTCPKCDASITSECLTARVWHTCPKMPRGRADVEWTREEVDQ